MTITLELTYDEWLSLRLAIGNQIENYDNINTTSPDRNPIFYAEEIENCRAILRKVESQTMEAQA